MLQHAAASLFSSKHPDLWPASKCLVRLSGGCFEQRTRAARQRAKFWRVDLRLDPRLNDSASTPHCSHHAVRVHHRNTPWDAASRLKNGSCGTMDPPRFTNRATARGAKRRPWFFQSWRLPAPSSRGTPPVCLNACVNKCRRIRRICNPGNSRD
jgi:hypothetical protein